MSDASERARDFAMRILPVGTQLRTTRLDDLRDRIAKEVEHLMRLEDELWQLKMEHVKWTSTD